MVDKVYYNEEKNDETITEAVNNVTTDSEASSSTNPKPEISVPTIINPQITSPYFKISPSGDITIGDYDNSKGAEWDQSAGTFTVLGTLNISSLNIPDLVTANSFHVDTDGNAWWGATTLAGAVAKILKTGVATFTNVIISGLQGGSALDGQYIVANSITSGKLSVSQLDAISANMGTLTAGTINGGTIIGNVKFGAGNLLFASADTVRAINGAGTSYIKRKDIKVNRGGTYRIKFTLTYGTAGGTTQYGRIYRNGVAVGTERSITTGQTEYSEDITGWSAGDNIQVYTKITTDQAGTTPDIQLFRIYVDNVDSSTVVTD